MQQIKTIEIKAYRLNTAIQRFNNLSLSQLRLVSIKRHFGHFSFICEQISQDNWKDGFNPNNKPVLSNMSRSELSLRVVSLLIDAYGQNLFKGSSCLKYNLQRNYISIPSSYYLKDEPICKEIFRILRYLRKENIKLDSRDLEYYADKLGYGVQFSRSREYNYGGRVYRCRRFDFYSK